MAIVRGHDNLSASPVVRTIEGNSRWEGPLTFSFIDTAEEARAVVGQGVTGAPLPAEWQAQIVTALAMYDDIVALDMSTTTSPTSDYLIGIEELDQFLGSALPPVELFPGQVATVSFNITNELNATEAQRGGGSERLQTIAHEVGHTLGLHHPHDDDYGTTIAPGSDPFGFDMLPPYLSHQTALSYAASPNSYFTFGGPDILVRFDSGRSVAPMAIDIAALHRLYGANMETRTGNTTYTLTDAGSADLDLSWEDGIISVGAAYYGIWDAGRADVDVIRYDGAADVLLNLMAATPNGGDATGIALAATARLTETGVLDGLSGEARIEIENAVHHPGGFFSSILTEAGVRIPGGYSIAQGVVIETASGGSGDDILIGNEADNVLIGNGGDDVMAGGAGDDIARFAGGVVGYALGRDGEAVTVGGPSGADVLYDVEALVFRDAFVLIDTATTLSDEQVSTLGYLYEAGLDRNGALNVAGLKNLIAARERGVAEEVVATRFLDSQEFANRNGAQETLSDRELVEVLYRNVLDRDGEAAGVDYWAGQVGDDAFSRGDLLLGFAVSDENRANATMLSVFDDAIM